MIPFDGQLKTALCFPADKPGMKCNGASLGIALSDEVSSELTMNFGVICGGGDSLTVKLNYRYPVTKSFEACVPLVKAAFEEAGFTQDSITRKKSLYMPTDSELVKKPMNVYRDCTGLEDLPKCIGGSHIRTHR